MPQYAGLSMDDILVKARTIQSVLERLPADKEILKLPKQWVVNVVYTQAGDPFAAWVQQKVKDRNEEVATKKDINISVDPFIA